jgi:hypothetical protein
MPLPLMLGKDLCAVRKGYLWAEIKDQIVAHKQLVKIKPYLLKGSDKKGSANANL